MSETCNAPTINGSACQNPTTDDGNSKRCWIPSHNDPDAENPQGRDFELGESDHDDILQAAREGLSKSGCARAAGVSHTTLNRYLDARPEFRSSFARARREGESELVSRGLHDPETDSSMAKFLLSTSFDYVKTEKRELEHSGPDGGPLNVTIQRTEYDGDE